MPGITDPFGRKFYYLRLSITDVCNFRCGYCLPNGYQGKAKQFLTLPEIRRLVAAFAELGMQKVRLTGGEPTVRNDFLEIAAVVANTPGVKKLALTTNGYQLFDQVQAFYDAGINAINVSVDSLNPEKFHQLTGHNRLPKILLGIQRAQQIGFSSVKINAVLLKDVNDIELPLFLEWIKYEKVSLRFIELMQTGTNREYFERHHVSADSIRLQLLEQGWTPNLRAMDAGPAIEFSHTQYTGKIGLIAPYAKDFCTSCNRLRVSAEGNLHLCLFGALGYPLRSLLQDDTQKEELKNKVIACLQHKKISHFLQDGNTGMNQHFSTIGG